MTAGEGHFGQRNEQSTVGDIMHGINLAIVNKLTHELCVRALFGKINGRRRTIFAAMQFAQP